MTTPSPSGGRWSSIVNGGSSGPSVNRMASLDQQKAPFRVQLIYF
jgi:hypothetical protein